MSDEIHRIVPDGRTLSRIALLDQRTALPDQCLLSAEADVRPPRRKSGFDPTPTSPLGYSGNAHAFTQPVAPSKKGRIVAPSSGAQATDGEIWI